MSSTYILEKEDWFNLGETLECGQCFNFEKIEDDYYRVNAFGKVVFIRDFETEMHFSPCTEEEFKNVWYNYFDLGRNYNDMQKILMEDEVMKIAIPYGRGIRILNQDHFECLISFIISQNNRIPMIKNVVRNLSEKYGEEVGGDYFTFPTVEKLNSLTDEQLRECKTGFRSKYIADCCQKIIDGEIDLIDIESYSSKELQEELMKIKGVGVKVANCVTLFSYGKGDSFPVDVWIKRAVEKLYFDGVEKTKDEIQKFGEDKFGDLSGIAQQYIFNYAIKTGLE